MKIIKFNKHKSNKYTLELDNNEEITLYDDVIVKYELIRTKEMDDKLYDEIMNYNSKLEAYYKALKYIQKKLRTELEIKKYLDKDYSSDIVSYTIDKLNKDGYLNSDIYIKSYINDNTSFSNNGPLKIMRELNKLGFSDEDIKPYLDIIDEDIWLEKLDKLISKRINSNHGYGERKLIEKINYEMSNNGYYKWMIDQVLSSKLIKDEDILDKEFNKVYNHFKNKYSGIELEKKIMTRLVGKGFSFDEIRNKLSDIES